LLQLDRFEKQLKGRLQLKASAGHSEEQLLLKTFKYFDIYNRGELNADQFFKAMDKLGLSSQF
jgi:hypothetical protein